MADNQHNGKGGEEEPTEPGVGPEARFDCTMDPSCRVDTRSGERDMHTEAGSVEPVWTEKLKPTGVDWENLFSSGCAAGAGPERSRRGG